MWHIALVAVVSTTILAPYCVVNSLQLIWKFGFCRYLLQVHDFQMSAMAQQGSECTRIVVPVTATRATCIIERLLQDSTHIKNHASRVDISSLNNARDLISHFQWHHLVSKWFSRIIHNQQNSIYNIEHTPKFVVNTVPADGLAPFGARPSAGTMMTIWYNFNIAILKVSKYKIMNNNDDNH